MVKKAHIIINLLPEASEISDDQIEKRMIEAKIPLCKEIETVSVEDTDLSYLSLKTHGISNNVAKNLMTLYTE